MKRTKIQFECINIHSKWLASLSIQGCQRLSHLEIDLQIISKIFPLLPQWYFIQATPNLDGIFDMLTVPKCTTIHNQEDLSLGYQMSVLLSNKCRNIVLELFLTTFRVLGWHWIWLEDPVCPLNKASLSSFHHRYKNHFFIDFSRCFCSWHAEMNRSSPITRHSPPHHHRRWVMTSLNSGNLCFVSFYLLNFCSMKNFLISENKIVFSKFLPRTRNNYFDLLSHRCLKWVLRKCLVYFL